MTPLTPREIVSELDRFIIGQQEAKRAVAVALRNRYRRKKVKGQMQEEIVPKNILMVGPTGVGKTEIARRLAKLSGAPFIKVEATKFTEVGYVGRDVESIIRDIMEQSIVIVREEQRKEVIQKAHKMAEERVVDALVGSESSKETRKKFRDKLRAGDFNETEIELDLKDSSPFGTSFEIPGMSGSVGMLNVSDMLSKAVGGRTKKKKIKVKDAHKVLLDEESEKLIDEDKMIELARELVENDGIVFIDEMDKIAANTDKGRGEVSREGVQRDLLPLIEGTVVSTKYGSIKTDHILFIASGAFHLAKPSDLLPELQGRLPIRVRLDGLKEGDMLRILQEPESSLVKQYEALIETEGVKLSFTQKGIEEIASIAIKANNTVENIGARRLHTVMEKLLEEISFEAGETKDKEYIIDEVYVRSQLEDITKTSDLSKFIL